MVFSPRPADPELWTVGLSRPQAEGPKRWRPGCGPVPTSQGNSPLGTMACMPAPLPLVSSKARRNLMGPTLKPWAAGRHLGAPL